MVIRNTAVIGSVERARALDLGELDRDERVRQHPFRALRQHRFALRTGRSPGPHAAMAYPSVRNPQRRALRHPMDAVMTGRGDDLAGQQLSLFTQSAPLGSLPLGRPRQDRTIERVCGWCETKFLRTTPGAGTKYCSSACKIQGYKDSTRKTPLRPKDRKPVPCAWCAKLVTPDRRPSILKVWPFICAECLEPIAPAVRTLTLHHVPHNRARSLVTDPGCEICGDNLLELVRVAGGVRRPKLVVDHDHNCCRLARHSCGKCVRGLICNPCNMAAGQLRDSPDNARALASYLDRWHAR